MINHIWSVLCRRSIVDRDTNNISIFDVFEQLTVEIKIRKGANKNVSKINLPIDYELVSFWTKDIKDADFSYKGEVKAEIIGPSGAVEKVFEQPLEMPKEMKRLRTRLQIKGFVAEESKIYHFQVSFKEIGENKYKKVASVPLEIIVKKITEPTSSSKN